MKIINKSIQIVFFVLILTGFALFLLLFNGYIKNQKIQSELLASQLKIQKESHIMSIYSTYKSNMDLCKQEANTQKKDKEFIRVNCIEALNNSILGETLNGWGKTDLLITE